MSGTNSSLSKEGKKQEIKSAITLLLLYLPLAASVLDLLPTFHWLLEINKSLSLYRVATHLLGLLWLYNIRNDFTPTIRNSLAIAIILLSYPTVQTVLNFYQKPEVETANTVTTPLRVFYANLFRRNTHYDELRGMIDKSSPDVVALVEFSKAWGEGLKLDSLYPYQFSYPAEDDFGLALYSRVPFSIHADGDVGMDLPHVIWTTLNLSSGATVELTLLHALPPVKTELFLGRRRLLKRVATRVRHIQGTQIVLGDFNSTPFTFTYQMFTYENGLKNAMQGYGFNATWKSGIFRFPIDHVLYRGKAKVADFKRLGDFGSDHYPLLVDFEVW